MSKALQECGKLSGPNQRVQIDESLFRGKRKYHRGRLLLGDLDIENASDSEARKKILDVG
jgi:hypothetical protein